MKPEEQKKAAGVHYPGLQINEDIGFKRKEWVFERLGWVFMALLVAAALAGLFSKGPLSSTVITDPTGSLEIRYEKFQRFQASSLMKIDVLPSAQTDRVALLLQGPFITDLEIETIRPQPDNATLTENGWNLEFRASSLPASIAMTIKPKKIGTIKGHIGLEGQAPAEIPIFVYP